MVVGPSSYLKESRVRLVQATDYSPRLPSLVASGIPLKLTSPDKGFIFWFASLRNGWPQLDIRQCFDRVVSCVSSRPRRPGGTGKPGDVIRGSGDGSPPAGSRGRAPGGGLWGQSPPKRGSGGGCDLDNRVWVCQGHWKCHHSLERIGLPTDMTISCRF